MLHEAVYDSPIEELARLVSEWRPFLADDPYSRFQCPRCRRFDHNGGTALIVNAWRWRCTACGAIGTKMELEDIVLRDPFAVESLIESLR